MLESFSMEYTQQAHILFLVLVVKYQDEGQDGIMQFSLYYFRSSFVSWFFTTKS